MTIAPCPSFVNLVKDIIEQYSTLTANKISVSLTLEDLYQALNLNSNTGQILLEASQCIITQGMQWHDINLINPTTTRPVAVFCANALLPDGPKTLIISNNHKPLVQVIREWSILRYVVIEVLPLVGRNAVGSLLPWLKDVFVDLNFNFGGNATTNRAFFRRYSISPRHQAITGTCIKALNKPQKHIPVVPTVLGNALLTGNKLFTQYRLIKDKPDTPDIPGRAYLKFTISNGFVPQYIKDAVQEMKDFQTAIQFLGFEED
jgi:hypothetical protein